MYKKKNFLPKDKVKNGITSSYNVITKGYLVRRFVGTGKHQGRVTLNRYFERNRFLFNRFVLRSFFELFVNVQL